MQKSTFEQQMLTPTAFHSERGDRPLRSGERGKDKKKRKARTCKQCMESCELKAECPGRHPRGRHDCACTNNQYSYGHGQPAQKRRRVTATPKYAEPTIPSPIKQTFTPLVHTPTMTISTHIRAIRGKDKKKRKSRTCRQCLEECKCKHICPGRHPRGKHDCACTGGKVLKKQRKPRTCRKCAYDCTNKSECPGRFPRGLHQCSCTGQSDCVEIRLETSDPASPKFVPRKDGNGNPIELEPFTHN